jgi:hypothetical protein
VALDRIFSGSILAEGWLNLGIQVALFQNIIQEGEVARKNEETMERQSEGERANYFKK